MQTIARSMADTGPMGGRYIPHAPPIVGRYGKRPHSRMRHVQLRTVHDLISSPRAFAGRAAPKERLVDSADVPAPRLTARGAQALLLVSRAVGVDRQPAALGFGSGDRLRRSRLGRRGGGPCGPDRLGARGPKVFDLRRLLGNEGFEPSNLLGRGLPLIDAGRFNSPVPPLFELIARIVGVVPPLVVRIIVADSADRLGSLRGALPLCSAGRSGHANCRWSR